MFDFEPCNCCLKKRIDDLQKVIHVQEKIINKNKEAITNLKRKFDTKVLLYAKQQSFDKRIYEDLGRMEVTWLLTKKQANPILGNCPKCCNAGLLGGKCGDCQMTYWKNYTYKILKTDTSLEENSLEINAKVLAKFMNANIDKPSSSHFQPRKENIEHDRINSVYVCSENSRAAFNYNKEYCCKIFTDFCNLCCAGCDSYTDMENHIQQQT